MAAEIRLFPCLTDNFGYLIHDPATKATASIDAPEADPVIKALEREGWTLTDILITHHHGDHVGGVAELKQKYGCRVVAPHDKSAKIADVDQRVGNGDVVKVGKLLARVLETPGHTLDHISYVFDADKALFAADTLFSIGCGRVIEGTHPMMWDSLLKLRALPDDFSLYCRETFRDARADAQGRAQSTAIYFLLARGDRSQWHRIDAVEIWHYYAGASLKLQIANDGCAPHSITLGPDVAAGERPQAIVPA